MAASPTLRAHSLFGRQDVLERLRGRLIGGSAAAVLLVGEPGIGKTRIAAELAAIARASGRAVLTGHAGQGSSTVTLAAVQDAVRAWRRESPSGELRDPLAAAFPQRLLPEIGAPAQDPTGRGALFEACSCFLRELAAPSGLLLIVEDLHWADSTTCELLPYLLRTAGEARLGLLITMRPDEARSSPSVSGLRHEMARSRLAAEVPLSPLTDQESRAMLAELIGWMPDAAASASLLRLAAGNPFMLEELVYAQVESGRLDPVDRRWAAGGTELSWTVSESIRARASRLAPNAQEVLRVAAALGERFDVRVLERMVRRPTGDPLEDLVALTRAGLLANDPADPTGYSMTFRHALTREAILQVELARARTLLHERALKAAQALRQEGVQIPAGVLAMHAESCHNPRLAYRYSVEAAQESLGVAGWQEAEAHYARALELWSPADGALERAELAMRRGRILDHMHRSEAAVALFEEAERAYLEAGDEVGAAVAHADAAAFKLVSKGEFEEGVSMLRASVSRLGPDAPRSARLRVLGTLATSEMMRGSVRSALSLAEQAQSLIDGAPEPGEIQDWIEVMGILGGAKTFLGEQAEGRRIQAQALALARRHGDHLGLYRALWRFIAAHRFTTAVADMAALADEAVALTHAWGAPGQEGSAVLLRATLHVEAGEWPEAFARLDDAKRFIDQLGSEALMQLQADHWAAELLLGQGQWEEAVAAFSRVAVDARREDWAWPEINALAGVGRARLLQGAAGQATAALEEAVERWRRAGGEADPEAVDLLVASAQAALLTDRGDPGSGLAVLHHFTEDPRARYGLAMIERPPGWAAAAATETDGIAALGRAPQAGALALIAGELCHRVGERPDAVALAERALRRFVALHVEPGAARARALLRSLGERPLTRLEVEGKATLTGRERQILGLISEGLTNRRIAKRLVLSEATVIRHVSNIFRKLGVGSRAQATRVGAERGLLGDE